MQTLRKLASDYMLNHEEDFLPFLTDTKTGEVYTPGTLTLNRPFNSFFNVDINQSGKIGRYHWKGRL